MRIDVQSLVLILGLAGTVGGMIAALFRLFSRFERMEKQAAHRKEDSEILLRTQLGVLEGLIEQGCNGPCKDALDKLEKHLNKEAHDQH